MVEANNVDIVEQAITFFYSTFKQYANKPRKVLTIAVAPGRVNLIGDHTDYNDGFVCPLALDKTTVVVGIRSPAEIASTTKVASTNFSGQVLEFSADSTEKLDKTKPSWGNYLEGVTAEYLKHLGRTEPLGVHAVIASAVPIGSGLSSSAALEVGFATFLESLFELKSVSAIQKALLCQAAEHEYCNVPCGIMDQFISSCGKKDCALLIDCRTKEQTTIAFEDPDIVIVVSNSNVKHEMNGGEYKKRVMQCKMAVKALQTHGYPHMTHLRDVTVLDLDSMHEVLGNEVVYRRARHVITENERTVAAVERICAREYTEVGKLMFESHKSLRDDYEVSTPELDYLVETARGCVGVYGARMTGGGFGGSIVVLVQQQHAQKLMQVLDTGYPVDKFGSDLPRPESFLTRIGDGAYVMQVGKTMPGQSPAIQATMLGRGAPLLGSLLRRNFSTSRVIRSGKRLNLTLYASPILLRLHPDTVQRQMPSLAQDNEEALKQLNVFLELAAFGCNNDAFNARKHVLALRESRQVISEEPVRFPLVFHVPVDEIEALEHVDGFIRVEYTIEVPGRLVKRTLSNSVLSVSARDPKAALQAPFAREWQRTTKRILQDLFEVAHVPLVVTEEDNVRTSALAEWLAEEATVVDEADLHGIHVGEQNRAKKREHEQFDKIYHAMLTHETNIVHEATTGLEDGPTTQHAVLTSLLHSRLFLPKFRDPHMKKSAFHWIANFLLVNFMELRLHSLVWNKVTLLVTADTDVKEPQVSWDEEAPEEGMGILVPVGMNADTLIDFMYENVEDLEFALETKSFRDQAIAKEKQRFQRKMKKKKGKQRRTGHFYQDEVNAIFRRA
ncbi:hypothetical protein DD238_006701 [Peronospora effusa]|uniref:Galactokinase n=1 Tax=Peronospora effusa TaxID=542832 RepID=A0A3M6VB27_9STRA|nr:hypothetical protein DD238_006701 [Peronospora effusa]